MIEIQIFDIATASARTITKIFLPRNCQVTRYGLPIGDTALSRYYWIPFLSNKHKSREEDILVVLGQVLVWFMFYPCDFRALCIIVAYSGVLL